MDPEVNYGFVIFVFRDDSLEATICLMPNNEYWNSHVWGPLVADGQRDHGRWYSVLTVGSVGLWERGGGGGGWGERRTGDGGGHWERLLRQGLRRRGGPHGKERAGGGQRGAGRGGGGAGRIGVGRKL